MESPSIQLTPVACSHCGAPLRVPADAEFVTCNHCETQLAVRRTDDVTYTKVLGEVRETTGRIATDVEILKLQNELQQLDLDHNTAQQGLGIRTEYGTKQPSAIAGTFVIVIATCMSLFLLSLDNSFHNAIGVIVLLLGWASGIREIGKADEAAKAEQRWKQRREDLTLELDKLNA